MSDQPEKLDLASHDIADDRRRELLRLFPEVATEGGKLDFDRLKLALGEAVDVGRERYGMNWPGKADCFKTLQTPSMGTLRPCPEESVNFDTSENLIIEGDNLEVLKLLQKSYLGKVKMIYIDPPYNTGNDFICPDNYSESLATCIVDDVFTADGTTEIRSLFGEELFDFSKPSALMSKLVKQGVTDEDIILDFFAGSGSTAHAVLDLNKQDGGNRKFVPVQLPEPTGRADYPTIADITKERVRRVIKKLNDADAGRLDLDNAGTQDRGFRVFKLAESNFKPWNASAPKDAAALAKQFELHIDHIRDGRSADDLLFEIQLKSGFPLATPVEPIALAGKTVHSVAAGALLICLERELTMELIRAMAAQKPQRVVCLDEGFAGNDQLKANAVQIFRTQGVAKFQTV